MARDVEAEQFLLEFKQFRILELVDIGQCRSHQLPGRRPGGRCPAEHRHLSASLIVLSLLADFHCPIEHLKQRRPLRRNRAERAALDQRVDRRAGHPAHVDALAEIVQAVEIPPLRTTGDDRLDRLLADARARPPSRSGFVPLHLRLPSPLARRRLIDRREILVRHVDVRWGGHGCLCCRRGASYVDTLRCTRLLFSVDPISNVSTADMYSTG